jgi:hypothetical protein
MRPDMNDKSLEERWGIWMTQAQNFEKRENYIEAVSRAALVARSASEALAAAGDAGAKARYAQVLLRAEKQRDRLQVKLDAWNAKIAARREAVVAGAEEEMSRPLPLPPPPARRRA